MLIEKLENKIKLALTVSITAIAGSIVLCIIIFLLSMNMVQSERKRIYVLDGNIPLLAQQTSQEVNLEVEAKSHIALFHSLFFTLPPDDEYIKYNLEKAMYLIDESGLKQKNALQEKGFYAGILSQSAAFSIKTDSIKFNQQEMNFTYYGTQRIERKSSILRRQLVTEGKLRQIQRSINNPHGLIITDYKTIINKDIEYIPKNDF
jgi:conjugative transposon TraK protein